MKTTLLATLVFVALAALYLLLAGEMSGTEMLAGIPAAALVAGVVAAAHAGRTRKLRLLAPWPRIAGRVGWSLLADTARLTMALARIVLRGPSEGTTATQPIRFGGPHAADAGRRAIVTLAISLAPNGYVLDGGEAGLRVHRLVSAPPDHDPEWPL